MEADHGSLKGKSCIETSDVCVTPDIYWLKGRVTDWVRPSTDRHGWSADPSLLQVKGGVRYWIANGPVPIAGMLTAVFDEQDLVFNYQIIGAHLNDAVNPGECEQTPYARAPTRRPANSSS